MQSAYEFVQSRWKYLTRGVMERPLTDDRLKIPGNLQLNDYLVFGMQSIWNLFYFFEWNYIWIKAN